MSHLITLATQAEAPHLARLCRHVQDWHAENYPEIFQAEADLGELERFFSEQIDRDGYRVLISWAEEKPAAYLATILNNRPQNLFQQARKRLFIEHVGTDPDFQRQGHARALFSEALAYAKLEGCGDAFLDTWDLNKPAHAYFEAMGFSVQKLVYARKLTGE